MVSLVLEAFVLELDVVSFFVFDLVDGLLSTSFVFDSPWLKPEGVEGLQKYYQVFLSAANPDTFFSGNHHHT
mgnify:CR=1 FL=1